MNYSHFISYVNKGGFTKDLRIRGFNVEYKSDQRDGDYYEITFPPQER